MSTARIVAGSLLPAAILLLGACGQGSNDQLLGEDGWDTPGAPPRGADGGDAGKSSNGDPLPGSDGATPPLDPKSEPALVDALTIAEVAVFQTVKVSVMKGGAAVTGKAPVVASRPALVRVYVQPGSGWTPHAINAVLTLQGGGVTTPLTISATPQAASDDATLGSTLNFDVAAGVLKTDTVFSVSLREPNTSKPLYGSTPKPGRYPQDGTLVALGAKSSGAQLKVVLVPIQYGADGSNRLPDTTPAQLKVYTDTMFALYPVPSVSVTVRAQPVAINYTVSANGTGWNQLLTQVLSVRGQDAPSADTYYYGIFAGASSFAAFCGGGCVAGLSPIVTSPGDAQSRASIGIGFSGAEMAMTMAHELGHAHGRAHAPCGGVAGPDPSFPYAGGGVGVWGYSLLTKQLVNPATAKDLMGYCNPGWFSDYTYGMVFDRVKAVNGASMVAMAPMPFRYASMDEHGAITWVGDATLTMLPDGEPRTVVYESAEGAPLGTATAYFYAHDHLPGGSLLVPAGPAGTANVHVERPSASTVMAHW